MKSSAFYAGKIGAGLAVDVPEKIAGSRRGGIRRGRRAPGFLAAQAHLFDRELAAGRRDVSATEQAGIVARLGLGETALGRTHEKLRETHAIVFEAGAQQGQFFDTWVPHGAWRGWDAGR